MVEPSEQPGERRDRERSWCLLLNERGAHDADLRAAVAELRDAGERVDVRALWEPGQARQFAGEAAARGVDIIVAGGGDGTVNETVNGLLAAAAEHPPAFGVVPLGSANDFGIGVGMPADDPAGALRRLARARPRPIDVGEVNGHFFVNTATAGIGAEITAETPRPLKELLGGAAYSLRALLKLADHTRRAARVTGPGLDWQGDLLLLIVAKARFAGGGYAVAPDARLDDRLLHVSLVPNGPVEQVAEWLAGLVAGRPGGSPAIVRQVASLEVEAQAPLALNVDGEPMRERHYRFAVKPAALSLLMPSP